MFILNNETLSQLIRRKLLAANGLPADTDIEFKIDVIRYLYGQAIDITVSAIGNRYKGRLGLTISFDGFTAATVFDKIDIPIRDGGGRPLFEGFIPSKELEVYRDKLKHAWGKPKDDLQLKLDPYAYKYPGGKGELESYSIVNTNKDNILNLFDIQSNHFTLFLDPTLDKPEEEEEDDSVYAITNLDI